MLFIAIFIKNKNVVIMNMISKYEVDKVNMVIIASTISLILRFFPDMKPQYFSDLLNNVVCLCCCFKLVCCDHSYNDTGLWVMVWSFLLEQCCLFVYSF